MKKENVKQDMTLEDKKKVIAESGIIIGAILLLCYFFSFSYVWNTSYGSEAGVNGWNYIISCLTWKFRGTGSLYGDIAIPFNYYARDYVRVLAVATTASLPLVIIYMAASALNIKKYRSKLQIAITILLYLLAANFLVCAIVALTMNGSKIIPIYCSGNPKCSIATLAFIPFLIALIMAIVNSGFIYKSKENTEE